MLRIRKLWPKSVAAKLYGVAALALATVAVLALLAMVYVQHTREATERLKSYSISGAGTAADLELLLERHRRIVESSPVQLDRVLIDSDRRASEEIADQMLGLANAQNDPLLQVVNSKLPNLIEQSRRVLYLAANFAQAEAIETAAEYGRTAKLLQDQIHMYRSDRLQATSRESADIILRGRTVTFWIMAASTIALLLIGPFLVFHIRSIVVRLKGITQTMTRLAQNETNVQVASTRDTDEVGDMARAVKVFKSNAVQLRKNHTEIEKLNRWFQIALNNMARGLSMFDADHRLIVCNTQYQVMYDLPDRLTRPGTRIATMIEYWTKTQGRDADPSPSQWQWLDHLTGAVESGSDFSRLNLLPNGRMISINCQPLADGGWVDVHEDVTEKHRSEVRIRELAELDTLTGLANRHHFLERLNRALGETETEGSFALFWLDLDHFKEVNDSFGHPAGDALLKAVGMRLTAAVRATDFIARLGGDEFAILQTGASIDADAVNALARRLIDTVSEPYQIFGHAMSVGVSIGIALAPTHGTTADELIKNGDIALYKAKSAGRGASVIFEHHFENAMKARRSIEIDLRGAIQAGELELHYQPILDLRTGRVTMCEALLRWRHPDRGLVPPLDFIPVAEDIGVISEIGAWALHEACRTAQSWPDHIGVAVNLSATQFTKGNLGAIVADALAQSGLAPHRLELEVTETLLLADEPGTNQTLTALSQSGVSIALDDFGTGYASLSYLRSFPFDKIKIDQTFVRDLPDRANCVAIVSAIASLARTLGMRTVAEGVETTAHLDLVSRAGCDEVQGYLFSRPVPAAEIVDRLTACETVLACAA
jgi:diguanylate cyclase (GGDEF)-like protein